MALAGQEDFQVGEMGEWRRCGVKKIIIIVICILVVTGCGQSPEAIEAALAETQMAYTPTPSATALPTDTPEPTLVPFSELNIEDLLFQSGDLPADYEMGQIRNDLIKDLRNLPDAVQIVQVTIAEGSFVSDGVVVFLYDDLSVAEKAYTEAEKAIKREEGTFQQINNVGEKGGLVLGPTDILFGTKANYLVFIRCHAVTYIQLFGKYSSRDIILNFGERVDKRLESVVCR